MRISTAYRYDESVGSLQRRQRDLSEVQAQMTSGKRISKPSDDPTGAARAERAFLAQQRISSEQRMVDASRNAMALADATLGHSTELLQSARETLITAGNGSYTPGERKALVEHLQSIRSQLLAQANQDDGAGGFVFGGQSGHTLPFIDTPTGVQSNATAGQQQLSTRELMPTTLDGAAVWLQAATGNGVFVAEAASGNTGQAWVTPGTVSNPTAITGDTYEVVFNVSAGTTTYSVLRNGAATGQANVPFKPGGDITVDGMSVSISGQPASGDVFSLAPSTPSLSPFGALDRAIAGLLDGSAGGGQLQQVVANGLRDLDAVMARFQSARSNVGAALNRLEQVDGRNQDRTLWAKTLQANTEDADMVETVSEFQNKQSGYQAALQSYALVQRMSLFDYIK